MGNEQKNIQGINVSGIYECRCGALKDFGEHYILPEVPFEIKCDQCGAVLMAGEESKLSE